MKRIFCNSHTSSQDQCLKVHLKQGLRKQEAKEQGNDEHVLLQDNVTKKTDTRELAKVFKERKHHNWTRNSSTTQEKAFHS